MNKVEELFEGKNFDNRTLELIDNFINEFDDLFGKYVSKDEIIRRIRENLNHNIEFCDFDDKSVLGEYHPDAKKIFLKSGLSEEELKDVFFHEMIHCITKEKDNLGFFKQEITRSGDIKDVLAVGFTEGFTQYVSKIRADKYGGHINSYPILTEQVENMARLIGVEKFLDMAFNDREKFQDLLMEAELIDFPGEEFNLLNQFDVIWECEKRLYTAKVNPNKAEANLMKAVLSRDNRLNIARSTIISSYLSRYSKKIEVSKEDLAEIYKLTNSYSEQLALDQQHEAYAVFFEKIENLELCGKSREEILEIVPEDSREMVMHEMNFRDLTELDTTELLKKVANETGKLYQDVIEGHFEEYYIGQITRKIFKGDISESNALEVGCTLMQGLARKILDKGYNIDTLSFELICFKTYGKVFNLYNANGENVEYLESVSTINEDLNPEELQICTDARRKEILSQNVELSEKDVIFVGKSGFILGYTGDDNYIAINELGEKFESIDEPIYNSSYAEKVVQNLRGTIGRYKKLEKLEAPDIILKEQAKRIRELSEMARKYRSRDKFTPQDIENATQNVSLDEIESIMSEFTGPVIDVKEKFEKGIGYNE